MSTFFKNSKIYQRLQRINLLKIKAEHNFFSAAFLARQRQTHTAQKSLPKSSSEQDNPIKLSFEECEMVNHKIYDQLHALEYEELREISNFDLLEQIFYMFKAFHKHCRNIELVIDKNEWEAKQQQKLIDPNSFPIHKTTQSIPKRTSIFQLNPELKKLIAGELNFYVQVEQSTLQHYESNNGVFLYVSPDLEEQSVKPGTLLGLVPGVVFRNRLFKPSSISVNRVNGLQVMFNENIFYPNPYNEDYFTLTEKQEELSKMGYLQQSLVRVPGDWINFYAIGHKINHESEGKRANCQQVDQKIPLDFFPQDYFRYQPIQDQESNDKNIEVVAIIAKEEIESGQELFQDYIDSMVYEIEGNNKPQWLHHENVGVKKIPQTKWLTRREYSNPAVTDFIGQGDQQQDTYFAKDKMLENCEQIDQVLNETILQVDGQDAKQASQTDKARILLGARNYKGKDTEFLKDAQLTDDNKK